MNETTRTIPRIRLVARIAAVLCLLGAVALLPVMAYALPVTTPTPALPVTAANYQVVTLAATDAASPGTTTVTMFKIDSGAYSTYGAGSGSLANVPIFATLGNHQLYWYSTDGNGTEATNQATVTITDSLPPLTITSAAFSPTFDGSASFTLIPTDNIFNYTSGYGITCVGSGVASTSYKLDNGAWTNGTTVATSVYGSHTVQFYSTDVAGNKEATESATFLVKDNTAPTSSDNAVASYTGSAAITLSAADNAGGSGVAHIYYQVDGTAGDAWNAYVAPISVGVGTHTLTYYAVDNSGNNEAPHAVSFTVNAADVTAPVTTYSGPANGASLANGTVSHITLTAADFGSGVAGLHYTVDGNAHVQNRVRAATLFGAPNLGVPGSSHPGGNAASIVAGNKSCIAAGCHPALALPTSGAIDHTGVTGGCVTCHTIVDAPGIVEPASHATHNPSWACSLCHGTSLVGPVMPADNGGNHFLGSEPDADGVCADCHTFSIDTGTAPVSTASTVTVSFDVSGVGSHTILYWAVDKAGNTETQHSVTFSVQPAQAVAVATQLSIGASPTSVKLPKPFVLSGTLTGAPVNGLSVMVYVKKPGKSTYSASSARLTYNATGTGSSWWYRYTPALKGAYSFYVVWAGNSSYLTSTSGVQAVTVK